MISCLPVPPPETRAGCAELPRPCPATSCRHHLAPEIAAAQIRARGEGVEFTESCSLDFADRVDPEGLFQAESATVVANALGLTRETVRQLESTARAGAGEDRALKDIAAQADVKAPEFRAFHRPNPKRLAYVAIDPDLVAQLREHVASKGGESRTTHEVFSEAIRLAIDPNGAAARAAKLRARLRKATKPDKDRLREDRRRLKRPRACEELADADGQPEEEKMIGAEAATEENTGALDPQHPTGDEIVAARKARGWSRAKLAQLAGIDVKTAVRAEGGEQVTAETLAKIAAALASEDEDDDGETESSRPAPRPVAPEDRGTTTTIVVPHIERVMQLVLAEAADGAAMAEREVKFYRLGMTGQLPEEWRRFDEQARLEADPEWAEYQRLRAKFGSKT